MGPWPRLDPLGPRRGLGYYRALNGSFEKDIMGGKINIKVMLFEVFGGRVLGEFGGNWGGKAIV